jgi:1,4-alpha-glucan branching enzyme
MFEEAFRWRRSFLGLLLGSCLCLVASSGLAQSPLLGGQSWQGRMASGQWRHFYVDVLREHSKLQVELEVLDSLGDQRATPFPRKAVERGPSVRGGDAEFFLRFGQVPTPGHSDFSASSSQNSTPGKITVAFGSQPSIKTGRYYLSVFARTDISVKVRIATSSLPSNQPGMGAKPFLGNSGTTFRVWAPNADSVRVAGQFNNWNSLNIPLRSEGNGFWSFDVRGAVPGQQYKYVIRRGSQTHWRSDPYEEHIVNSVGNSIIFDDRFAWTDQSFVMPDWNSLVIYQMHIGTFNDEPGGRPGTFHSAVGQLDYLVDLGVNAIKLLPVLEFAGDYSWGYNPAYPFAVEEAYGGPYELKRFVNEAHQRGIAVILDLVFNHFGPSDLGLWRFDGWHEGNFGGIYFYQDARSVTPWGDTRPDYGRSEVRQYIRDNVLTWLQDFHADGLRWDSTFYTRVHDAGELPEGWSLMQWVNDEIDARQPWKISIAEDLQGNPWVTKSTGEGGAGFDAQWSSGFVHPIRNAIVPASDNARSMWAVKESLESAYNGNAFQRVIYTESHDEVANGRSRIPEEIWQGNAGSWWSKKRSTLGGALVMTAPGIPMIFQGQEILEDGYFQDTDPLDWSKLVTYSGIHALYRDLIQLRRNWHDNTRGLRGQHLNVFHVNDSDKVLAFHRWDQGGPRDDVIVVCNFRAADRPDNYRIGLPRSGNWRVRFNSDWAGYSADFTNRWVPDVTAQSIPWNGMPFSGTLPIPAYSTLILSQD